MAGVKQPADDPYDDTDEGPDFVNELGLNGGNKAALRESESIIYSCGVTTLSSVAAFEVEMLRPCK